LETRARSIVKALTWRTGGLLVTIGVTWAITGRSDLAALVGAGDTLVKLFAYYFHERLWLKVCYGRLRPPEYEI
jgi:adenylylsulfate kinase